MKFIPCEECEFKKAKYKFQGGKACESCWNIWWSKNGKTKYGSWEDFKKNQLGEIKNEAFK